MQIYLEVETMTDRSTAMRTDFVDHYLVLGISNIEGLNLVEEDITKLFKKKALKLHPDKNLDDPNAKSKFQKLLSSYQILKNPTSRKKFHDLLYEQRSYNQQKRSRVYEVSESLKKRSRVYEVSESLKKRSKMRWREQNVEARKARKRRDNNVNFFSLNAAAEASRQDNLLKFFDDSYRPIHPNENLENPASGSGK
ncbi:pre-mRNA-splicing factor cwf23-like [Mercurialis annua]|uniref:pre-mRNA-splicing factor cwf23-like n=1 Tax=Mercurialis annua TaxID=3986 RepID=UPI00215E26B8|nr:pre-mRNA-splicing factor cwf23-like [Mercurialis annua]